MTRYERENRNLKEERAKEKMITSNNAKTITNYKNIISKIISLNFDAFKEYFLDSFINKIIVIGNGIK